MNMNQTVIIGIAVLLMAPYAPAASRLENLADRLAAQADDLAADSYRGFVGRDRGNRADVEVLYLAKQFSASATLFRSMVFDRRTDSELRDSLVILSQLLRGADRYGFGRRQFQDMQRLLDDLSREVGVGRQGREDNFPSGRVTGRMRWRGNVDDEVQIYVQNSEARARVISGVQPSNTVANFTAGLPRRRVTVELANVKGRGSVDIIQQPSPDNDFTAVVRIRDTKGGSSDYEFEITW